MKQVPYTVHPSTPAKITFTGVDGKEYELVVHLAIVDVVDHERLLPDGRPELGWNYQIQSQLRALDGSVMVDSGVKGGTTLN